MVLSSIDQILHSSTENHPPAYFLAGKKSSSIIFQDPRRWNRRSEVNVAFSSHYQKTFKLNCIISARFLVLKKLKFRTYYAMFRHFPPSSQNILWKLNQDTINLISGRVAGQINGNYWLRRSRRTRFNGSQCSIKFTKR